MLELPEYPKLKIHRTGSLSYNGSPVAMDAVNYAEFMVATLDSQVELEQGMLISELIHALYPLKEFIKNYNAEDYEVIRSYMVLNKLVAKCEYIKICKSVAIEEGYLETIVIADIVLGEDGTQKLSDIPVVIEEDILLEHEEMKLRSKSRIKLFDVLTSIFEDLQDKLTNKQIMTT